MLCLFYITNQCQRAQAKEEYECSTKEFEQWVSNPSVLKRKGLVFYHDFLILKEKWYQLCEILKKQIMKVWHFSIVDLDIP